MAEEFKAGDTVQLKSGGPSMTVTQTGDTMLHTNQVWCVWFEGSKKKEDTFAAEVLQKVEAQPISYPKGAAPL